MIGADTSVLVRYLVGSPPAQARRAAALIDGDQQIGVSIVALAACAHVLCTHYGVEQRDVIDSIIGLVQRENVMVIDQRHDIMLAMLVRARELPGRPIPDALIVAASVGADAVPLATFDRDQGRYGVEILGP